ncbi:MAG: IS110 family transposase [Clostridia bacterium]|nr:IS110 family transposase [Clostridia bacterium]
MIYIGIDVAKDKHDCHIVREDGEILLDNYTFANSAKGFQAFYETVKRLRKRKEEVKIGLEYTGHYSQNLYTFLKENKLTVVALNPLTVNMYRKSRSLRNTKTDKSDARFIAEVTAETEVDKRRHILSDINTLKSLTRYRYRVLKTMQTMKNRYRRVLQIVFPEFETIFNVNYKTTIDLLVKYPSPKDVLKTDRDTLIKSLDKLSRGHYGKKAGDLIEAAETSIGRANAGDAFELKHLAKQISFLQDELDALEERLKTILSRLDTPILTIPGIGVNTGAAILSEIGNIKNFKTPAKLLAFVGCEPTIYQSGKYLLTRTPMVKKGSRYLRNAVFQATKAAYITDPIMRAYVDKKRAEGKHFFVALSHGMKKMVRIIFSILTSGKEYRPPMQVSEVE